MQEVSAKLKAYMKRRRLTQAGLAKEAEVSQATVCRALRGAHLRHGAARERLFQLAGVKDRKAAASEKVVAAFEGIWDKTDEHTEAVVRVIRALRKSKPKSRVRGTHRT